MPYLRTIIPYSVLFPDESLDFKAFKTLLAGMNLRDTLSCCAWLNYIVTNPDIQQRVAQTFIAQTFLTAAERTRAEQHHDRTSNSSGLIVFRGQILELIRWSLLLCAEHPTDGVHSVDGAFAQSFIRTLMYAGSLWENRVWQPYVELMETDPTPAGKADVLGVIRSSVEGTRRAMSLHTAIGRGGDLFGRLCDSYPEFGVYFEEVTGLSLQRYYHAQFALLAHIRVVDWRAYAPTNIKVPLSGDAIYAGIQEDIAKLIALEGQSVDKLRRALWGETEPSSISDPAKAPPYNLLPLRRSPILITEDGAAIILDYCFKIDQVAVGPYFHLSAKIDIGRLNDCWGQAFEDYVCATLEDMFPSTPSLATRLTCNTKIEEPSGQVELYDACLNDATEVVVFEVTARFLAEASLTDETGTPTFGDALSSKYGDKLEQISRNVARLITDNPGGRFELCERIYPVLVVHDNLLSTPFTGEWFSGRFAELMAAHKPIRSVAIRAQKIEVAPLTILSVDALDALHTSVQQFGFQQLLSDYTDAVPDGSTSLMDFLAMDERYRNLIRRNERHDQRAERMRRALISLAH